MTQSREAAVVVGILLCSAAVRILLFPSVGYYVDLNSFKAWLDAATEYGPAGFYGRTWSDYPPFSVLLFWLFGTLAKRGLVLGITDLQVAVKLAPMIFDLANVILIYSITRTSRSAKYALVLAAIYAFNPATIYNSAVWGQYDSIFTFFLILAVFLAVSKIPELAGVTFTLALLTKPQSIALLPLLVFVVARKHGLFKVATTTAAAVLTALIIALPFDTGNPLSFIYNRYLQAYGLYPYNSLNAFNIWAFLGFWKPDSQALTPFFSVPTLNTTGWILFGGATALVLYRLNKKWDDTEFNQVFLAASTLLFAFFMLPTRIHERYLFPAIPMLLLAGGLEVFYSLVSITFFYNQAYAASFLNRNDFIPDFDSMTLLVTAANIALLFLVLFIPERMKNRSLARSLPLSPPKRTQLRFARKDVAIVVVISTAFLVAAVWNLGATSWPQTAWQPKGGDQFSIDIGTEQHVRIVELLLRDSNPVRGVAECGEPGEPTRSVPFSNEGYHSSWYAVNLGCTTRYLNLEFDDVSPREAAMIAEIAVFDRNLTKLPILAATPTTPEIRGLEKLYDEQGSVESPPTYFTSAYFDEIYYVRTAEEHLRLQFPFEWTHPPFGKLIIATGIIIFGYNPFGWRIMGVIFATLMIPAIYLLGREMFETRWGATAAAALLSLDFMHITMARIATVDTFVVFFSILMHLFLYKYLTASQDNNNHTRLGVSIILGTVAFSLAFACKWNALYGFAAAIVLLLLQKIHYVEKAVGGRVQLLYASLVKPFGLLVLSLLVGVAIYFASYIPVMLGGQSFLQILSLQESMYNYHAHLTATHPFGSAWWTWPFILQPVWFAIYTVKDNLVSTIVAMGNPAIWWAALPSIALVFWRAFMKRDFTCLYIGTVFMVNWLAYASITRVLFIYHFYLSIPIVILATSLWLDQLAKRKWGIPIYIGYIATAAILFAIFFPVLTGIPAAQNLTEQLKWLSKWYF